MEQLSLSVEQDFPAWKSSLPFLEISNKTYWALTRMHAKGFTWDERDQVLLPVMMVLGRKFLLGSAIMFLIFYFLWLFCPLISVHLVIKWFVCLSEVYYDCLLHFTELWYERRFKNTPFKMNSKLNPSSAILLVGDEYIELQEECFLISQLGGKAFCTVKFVCKSATHLSLCHYISLRIEVSTLPFHELRRRAERNPNIDSVQKCLSQAPLHCWHWTFRTRFVPKNASQYFCIPSMGQMKHLAPRIY